MTEKTAKKRHNMRDVARYAGVSVATVSRVVSGASSVADTTQARVRSAIDALNFVPSAAARVINSGRSYMVGALVPTLDHAIFSRFLDALERELADHGFSLVVATTHDDPDREARRAQDLLNLGVEGFVVSGLSHSDAFGDLIARYKTPVIATSYFDPSSPLVTVGYDNGAAALRALDHLVEMGHETIAVLSGPMRDNDRTRARVRALKRQPAQALQFHDVPMGLAASESVEDVLQSDPRVTAILCLSDVIAQGAMNGLRRLDVRVPEDMSVVGVDDLPSSQSIWPPLSSVHLPVTRMGTCAAERLARWIETGERARPLELETRMVARSTVRSLDGRAREP
ncbi:LacI family DNA-binding transcriptional regulator [uncultured Roseobacter sp.]|uniref:LacI family DNA-binding transcriptional regulator n=1 Tax=uncultured Roseobacter sp. TaxID=114847 RepID=UPI00260D97A2|nr:LacI family DNA-binding transcriptional regulator [uncultured Roseobacter sp.]